MVEAGHWKDIQAARGGISFSHIFFANGLVIFGEATTRQVRVMRNCLELFCSLSGQKVNFQKSCIYVSPNISKETTNVLVNEIGSPCTYDLSKYLGVSVIHQRVGKRTYVNLVDKVCNRLAAWEGKTLSLASRLTLIKAMDAAMPIYTMQTSKLPISTCDKFDNANRDFLWGHSEKNSKTHLVAWDSVCHRKEEGGLG